jgi:hypothetical protein
MTNQILYTMPLDRYSNMSNTNIRYTIPLGKYSNVSTTNIRNSVNTLKYKNYNLIKLNPRFSQEHNMSLLSQVKIKFLQDEILVHP